MAKGGRYEREVCRQLSLWWSGGKRSDLCWRSSQSGGRATTRAKKGLTTTGHCGDVCATSPAMEPFFRRVTVEIKRGYNRSAFMADLLDRRQWPSDKSRKETILGMIEQATAAAERAGTDYWVLVHRRDGREALVYMPRRFYVGCSLLDFDGTRAAVECAAGLVMVMKFEDWLREVSPTHFTGRVKTRSKR